MEPAGAQTSIKLRVLFFGAARDAVGQDEIDFEIDSSADAAGVRAQLLATYPVLQRFGNSLLFAVNQEYAQPDQAIHPGDEIAIFPPVSGGSAGSAGILPASSSDDDFLEL